jgi:DNA modification methylase
MQDVANGVAMPNTEILKQALNDHFQNKGDLSKETIESISKMISGSSSKLPYQDFLKRKIKVAENYGFQISQDEINPICKPHQKDIVQWALAGGRRAVFASFGLGKTVMQLEIGYHLNRKTNKPILFGLPLAVRGEFIKDATMLKAGRNGEGYDIRYCRNNDEVQSAVADGVTFIISNYERIRTGSFDMKQFGGVCLDEASVIRSMGSQTTQYILANLKSIQYRFVFTATPSPNEYHELLKYSEFLGIMDIGNALSRFFKRNSVKAHDSTLLEHREQDFWLWLSTWATFIVKPSDLGYDDTGYDFPEFKVVWHRVTIKDRETMMKEQKVIVKGQIKKVTSALLIPDQAKGLTEVSKEKKVSLQDRVDFAKELVGNDNDNWILWHHREDERALIQKSFGPKCKSVYGSQDEEQREDYLMGFAAGKYKYLSTKPEIAGSGCNLQYFCHKALFVGIDYKFNDFIQAVHRIYRYGQEHPVEIHIIYTDLEEDIKTALERKWRNHNNQVEMMTKLIRENKLTTNVVQDQKRKFGLERQEFKGKNFTYINNDSCIELPNMATDSIDMICTSIPFSDLFEYADSYSDMGQSLGDAEFFQHMDYLTPELYRVLQPGRIAAIHVKDVVKYRWQNDFGFPITHRFSDKTADHFESHGFAFFGRITVTTDVVRENNQTYRLGWSEKCKDGTKMSVGLSEYILLFRKEPTDQANSYADIPVTHDKMEYPRAKWQLDAHGYWKSNANRLLTSEEISRFKIGDIMAWWNMYSLENPYDFETHVKLCEQLEKYGKLPSDFMVLPPKSDDPMVWDDIQRIMTLNTKQAQGRMVKHVCPLQTDLIERLVELFTNPGETVLDPFGGIGSTGYQCIKMKSGIRKSVLVELNSDYWTDGIRHCTAEEYKQMTPTLFDILETV